MSALAVLIATLTDDGENEKEEVDDVEVEVESGEDVFLRRDRVLVLSANHQLSVKHQVLQETITCLLSTI